MGTVLVVIDHPPVGGFSDFIQGAEQVKAEHFISIGSIETFDISVLVWFSWLNVVNHHAGSLGPCDKVAAEKLWPVIGPKNIGESPLGAQPFKYSNQSLAGEGSINFNCQAFTVKVVYDIERPESFASIEGIAHEVGRPDLIRVLRHPQRLFNSCRQPLPGAALLVQTQLAVDPIDPLMIPRMAL